MTLGRVGVEKVGCFLWNDIGEMGVVFLLLLLLFLKKLNLIPIALRLIILRSQRKYRSKN